MHAYFDCCDIEDSAGRAAGERLRLCNNTVFVLIVVILIGRKEETNSHKTRLSYI